MHSRPFTPHTPKTHHPFLYKTSARKLSASQKIDRGIRPILIIPRLGIGPESKRLLKNRQLRSICILSKPHTLKPQAPCPNFQLQAEDLTRDLEYLQIVQDKELAACLRLSASLKIADPDIQQKALWVMKNQPDISLQIAALTNLEETDKRDQALREIIYKDTIPISSRIDAAKNLNDFRERQAILKEFIANDKLDTNARLKAASYMSIDKELEVVIIDLLSHSSSVNRLELHILQHIDNESLKEKMALYFVQKGLNLLTKTQIEDPKDASIAYTYELIAECIEHCFGLHSAQERAALEVCQHVNLSKDFLRKVANFIKNEALKQDVLQCIELGLRAPPGSKTKSAAKVFVSL